MADLKWLTPSEYAARLGVSATMIRRMIPRMTNVRSEVISDKPSRNDHYWFIREDEPDPRVLNDDGEPRRGRAPGYSPAKELAKGLK